MLLLYIAEFPLVLWSEVPLAFNIDFTQGGMQYEVRDVERSNDVRYSFSFIFKLNPRLSEKASRIPFEYVPRLWHLAEDPYSLRFQRGNQRMISPALLTSGTSGILLTVVR